MSKIIWMPVAVVALLIYNAHSWGYVCYKFWYWFLLPVFDNVPRIGYYQAVGVVLFLALFKNHGTESYVEDPNRKYEKLANFFLTPWLLLLFGYLINSLFIQ